MLTRILTTTAIALGAVVCLVGAVAVPSALPAWVGIGAAAGLTAPILSDVSRSTPLPRAARRRTAWRVGSATTGSLLALVGSVTLLGPGVVAGLALVLAFGWGLRWTSRTVRGPSPTPPDPVGPPLHPAVGDATTAELRLAWRRSWFTMSDLPQGPLRHQVADLRAEILDELERRHPDPVRRWLESGARANGDPLQFLVADPDR